MKKTFVLDTNILLHSPEALKSFTDNEVVLPMAVLEELDKFKSNQDELGRNARYVIRLIDQLRVGGNLRAGVLLKNATDKRKSGVLKIMTSKGKIGSSGLDIDIPDNRILRAAYRLYEEGCNVIFVSKDINLRLKADALGLEVRDFEKQKINFDELYSGSRSVDVDSKVIDNLQSDGSVRLSNIDLFPNEFVLMRDNLNPKHSSLGISFDGGDKVEKLSNSYKELWKVHPRSKEQRMSMEILMNPEIQIVTLVGQAGSGKTLLALAAGLESVINFNNYEKILVSRPIIPMGKDLGFLPGDKDQKLLNWMQPIFDNLDLLTHCNQENQKNSVQKNIDDLFKKNIIELEALTYIRGRSIPRQFVIIDEAQNLTPHEIKTIISRAGEGTKMILTGDPYQIDNPYLDSASNGLSYAVERLKKLPIHGHITLNKSERSKLAATATEYL